jgi:hypothetical protein
MIPAPAAAERRTQLAEVSLGTDQPYAVLTASKREIARERVNPDPMARYSSPRISQNPS